MSTVKSYAAFRRDVLATYDKAQPPDTNGTRNTEHLAEWLLNAHCELLERYALYQEFVKSSRGD